MGVPDKEMADNVHTIVNQLRELNAIMREAAINNSLTKEVFSASMNAILLINGDARNLMKSIQNEIRFVFASELKDKNSIINHRGNLKGLLNKEMGESKFLIGILSGDNKSEDAITRCMETRDILHSQKLGEELLELSKCLMEVKSKDGVKGITTAMVRKLEGI